jgi:hypothetical protein
LGDAVHSSVKFFGAIDAEITKTIAHFTV